MTEILIVGGGWAGCSAALTAAKQGAKVTLLEKTDMLLGAGNVGGIMRNNGRFTAAEENIALGAGELFKITDKYSVHRNVNFPGHMHASFYDAKKVEPAVRGLLRKRGIDFRLSCRAVDVDWSEGSEGEKVIEAVHAIENGRQVSFKMDGVVEATGSSGPMGNCMRYGNGCSMCIQRCPAFGPRVSLTARAGAEDISARRDSGRPGALSGSCKLDRRSVSPKLRKKLSKEGVVILKLPPELIEKKKLKEKVCQQYALDQFAENLILLDTGDVKLMTSYFPLEKLHKIEGLENAKFTDPYAGGKGNSVRYMSVGEREDTMRAKGFKNMYLAGEKSGFFIGHTEAITTGSLAGYNVVRGVTGLEEQVLPRSLAVGELLAYAQEMLRREDGLYHRFTFAGGEFFERMQELGLYQVRPAEIQRRVAKAGLKGLYEI